MKKILIIFLLASLPLCKVAWAAEKTTSSVDQLNSDYFDQDQSLMKPIPDPLEPVNRVFFKFNNRLYFWVEKPVMKGYSAVFPHDIRKCFGNFFDNIASPISFLNNLLQGRFSAAWTVLERFCINTTLGIYGFGDPATRSFNITPRPADFGETLGVWGVGEGIYICWPFIGPSDVRDSVGYVADIYTHPTTFMDMTLVERGAYYSGERINWMSLHPDVYEDLIKYSIDPYIAARQAFHEHRQEQIRRHRQ